MSMKARSTEQNAVATRQEKSAPPPERPRPAAWGWTPAQARVLLVLLGGLLVVLTVRYARNPQYISNPQPDFPVRYHDLADRIDPNTADWPTLAALPAIGEKRAKDIVAGRDAALAARPGTPAFREPNDLLRIRGIGPAMVSAISPYLIFPRADAPATRPVTRP